MDTIQQGGAAPGAGSGRADYDAGGKAFVRQRYSSPRTEHAGIPPRPHGICLSGVG